jgi:hypothetical protein
MECCTFTQLPLRTFVLRACSLDVLLWQMHIGKVAHLKRAPAAVAALDLQVSGAAGMVAEAAAAAAAAGTDLLGWSRRCQM